jgi:hypothetical protein
MVRSLLIAAALTGVLAIGGGCDDRPRITAPTPSAVAPQPEVAARPLPPLTGAAITYAFREALESFSGFRSSRYTEGSTFVLYESGDFALRFVAVAYEARGRYERDHGQIYFYFGERSAAADAIGTLRGNLMEVRYSEMMQHSDFENAVYEIAE